jgi:hypothetical protein
MARRPSRKAQRSAMNLMLAPAVIAMRMPLLLAESREGAIDQKETCAPEARRRRPSCRARWRRR